VGGCFGRVSNVVCGLQEDTASAEPLPNAELELGPRYYQDPHGPPGWAAPTGAVAASHPMPIAIGHPVPAAAPPSYVMYGTAGYDKDGPRPRP
jgi:hypothetical protein